MSHKNMSIRQKLRLLLHLIVKVKNDDIFALASQLAYYLLLSFFPFIIFLITLIGFSNMDSIQILNGIRAIVPEAVFDLTASIIVEVFDKQYTGLLGISILLALWTSSSGFRAVIKGVNKAYNFKEHRSFIKRLIISMISVIALALTIILALSMLVFGNVIGNYIVKVIPFTNLVIILWNICRYAFVVIIMIFIFASIYRFTPSKRLRWREVIPGSIFSTLGWIVTSYGFSFYIDNFRNFSRFYGSLGAVFILMTWLFLISILFILGVEINCVLEQFKKQTLE
ncbi:YihY/virulence factor BrkB family protein [Clostridium botulinum]|uniref:YihY/virulence factor BrkB family protein n=1 Tax=Clostridium botulinum TaxID=1491 RepID=UPI0013F03550|nr:YihY/virulence factor BrkB family protein [Clostridium botulinum]NFG24408.1 YihY/virulence factor BrkB family protein [Clostridium botulinum]NFO05614.1 YihY/virulence factor BrkB family protein [Clostridium botulinum]NFR16073.1 YihY/virulence factor BrkB family protein [Clostridium botulinum]NFR43248.1 YihY/virulence factor BrkB family protein [Clostridium botulinum]NFS50289.1 YihY/virulence factor BrkB family protein [Clostridium botulinum]